MFKRKLYFGLVLLVIAAYLCTSIFFIRTSKSIVDTDGNRAIAEHLHLSLDHSLQFDSDHNAQQINTWFGWYPPESWGAWSDGKRAFLYINIDKTTSGNACLLIHGQTILSKKHRRQRVKIFFNGSYAGTFTQTLDQPNAAGYVHIPSAAMQADASGNLALELLSPDATSPRAIGIGPDIRILGFGISSLQLIHCTA